MVSLEGMEGQPLISLNACLVVLKLTTQVWNLKQITIYALRVSNCLYFQNFSYFELIFSAP